MPTLTTNNSAWSQSLLHLLIVRLLKQTLCGTCGSLQGEGRREVGEGRREVGEGRREVGGGEEEGRGEGVGGRGEGGGREEGRRKGGGRGEGGGGEEGRRGGGEEGEDHSRGREQRWIERREKKRGDTQVC